VPTNLLIFAAMMPLFKSHLRQKIFQLIWPHTIWQLPNGNKEVYLTFDDGPTPGVTDVVLDTLQRYQVKATFFVIGKNVQQHPALYQRILDEGHAVGNHTMRHLRGWQTPLHTYLKDVQSAATLVQTNLFRPPYGRITRQQAKALGSSYKLVMWSLLTKDYDPKASQSDIRMRIKKGLFPGAIVVFHDSIKAQPRLFPALEYCLERCVALQLQAVSMRL
jgi:peptidoglycan-N-acetylglucosamine deacetylase